MRLTFIACLLFLSLSASVSATAVLLFHVPGRIILGTDSRLVTQHGAERGDESGCKIHAAGRWWVTVAGFSKNTRPPLNVETVLIEAIGSSKTLSAVGDAIELSVFPRIQDVLTRVHRSESFRSLFPSNQLLVALLIAGVNHDQQLQSGLFTISLEVAPFSLTPAWMMCPGQLCSNGEVLYSASAANGPAVQLLHPPRAPWVAKADAAAARKIIELQVAETPELVAGPIDVLELRAGRGATWVARDPASTCAAVIPPN